MFRLVVTTLLLSSSSFGSLAKLVPLLSEPTVNSEADHLAQLVDGIERICPERRSSSILVLFYVDGDVTVEHVLVALSQRYPIMVQNSNFSGIKQPWFTKCIIGFFSSADAFKSAEHRFPYIGKRILVFPHDHLEEFVKHDQAPFSCLAYMYSYNPDTLAGSWLIHHLMQPNYTLDLFEKFERDMRGYRIVFLNTDFMRDSTFDNEIGTTIAQRHNGSFQLIMMPEENRNIDYFYSIMYMSHGDYIALPEVTELCFMVPRSGLKSLFWVLIDPYDAFAWIAFGTSVFLVSLVLACFGESLRHYGLGLVILEILMSTVNGPTHKFVGPFESRVVGLFLLLCIVLISGYQSLVISFMSAPRYDPELNTMQQINDSCFFQRDIHLLSLGYNFKNTYEGFVEDNSVENSWRRKMCQLLPCSETKVINVNSDGEPTERMQGLELFSTEELEMIKLHMKYFRYSKARLQSHVGLYQVSFDSPARHLLERYTRAFIEGRLHYFPVLQKTKQSTGEYSPKNKLVETTGPGDLLIIWIIYVVGVLVSLVSFLGELSVLCVRKMKRVQWRRSWSSLKRLFNKTTSKKNSVVECY